MIEKITDLNRLYNSLSGKPDIFSGKIKALAEGYGTGYDFLTFYSGDKGITAAKYYNSAVISGNTDDPEALDELPFRFRKGYPYELRAFGKARYSG